MRIDNPFHEGELQVQERVGVLEEGRRNAAAIADSIVKGALKFVAQQPMVVLGSVDDEQNVWASVLFGRSGFVEAEDDRTVIFDLTRAARDPHDPFWDNIERDPRIGMLVIDLATRRRLRINGRIGHLDSDRMRLDVEESYPNCPKYIQRRQAVGDWQVAGSMTAEPLRGHTLLPEHRSLLTSIDTFFIASANPRGGVDASHRGGNPGFVRVLNETTIRIPDYRGNSMFNTFGNFVLHPHAGLVLLDFERSRILQLVGRPVIQWDVEDALNETGGTKRYWDLEVERWLESELPYEIRWELLDYSPHNPKLQTITDDNSTRGEEETRYICPLCEGVEDNEPGDCPQCGMPLCSDHVGT